MEKFAPPTRAFVSFTNFDKGSPYLKLMSSIIQLATPSKALSEEERAKKEAAEERKKRVSFALALKFQRNDS